MTDLKTKKVTWEKGKPFRIESDGTTGGTLFIDGTTGKPLSLLTGVELTIDSENHFPEIVLTRIDTGEPDDEA